MAGHEEAGEGGTILLCVVYLVRYWEVKLPLNTVWVHLFRICIPFNVNVGVCEQRQCLVFSLLCVCI